MPNSDQTRIDAKIKEELRSFEAPYNESHWQELEPYVSSLQPKRNLKFNGKIILLVLAVAGFSAAAYFVIPNLKRNGDEESTKPDSIVADTASTDPTYKPDTITGKPVVIPVETPPVNAAVDSSTIVSADTMKKEEPKREEPVTSPADKPKKKKKKEVKKEEPAPNPVIDDEGEDLFKKDVPIIAVPQDDPKKDQPQGPPPPPNP